MNFSKLNTTSEHIEINNKAQSLKPSNKFIEIFTATMQGKDTSRYGGQVDQVLKYMKHLGEKALAGDVNAKAEINSVRTIMIQTPLLQRLNLFSFMGNVTTVGMNEELRYRVHQLQGKMSGVQANSGSFPFPTQTWRTGTMPSKTATGGVAVDYREIATLDFDAMAQAHEQVITDMMNQMFYDIMFGLYSGIKNAKSDGKITNFVEATGITKTSLDNVTKKARRFGKPTIAGDYSVITQLGEFAGFKTDTSPSSTTVTFSDTVMEEIRKSGYIKTYFGTPVVEIPNAYNLTKLNEAEDFYETYLPEGLLFCLPQGVSSPLQVGIKSGIRSMTGQDIDTAQEITRYDLEWGYVIIPELIPQYGLVSDNTFTVDKR